MKLLATIALCAAGALTAFAQTTFEEIRQTPEKAGGVYYAYPVTETHPTTPPKGYKPFHISHYGRHGSRYLISDRDYRNVLDVLKAAAAAGKLTPLGKNVALRLDTVMIEARGRGGDLTPLGVRQHRGIAGRMAQDYPEVFRGNTSVSARSTTVPRCILSMDAFCERLKEINPRLRTTRESSDRYMDTLNYHSQASMDFTSGPWKVRYNKFERDHVKPERLMASLFNDPQYVLDNVDSNALMWGLYWIAADMQDMETDISFMDIFEPQELFDIWQCVNYQFYVRDGNYPGSDSLLVDNASRILTSMIHSADTTIINNRPSVALRFGHDGNLIPLTALLGLKDCAAQESDPEKFYTAFSDFKIAPMAGNVQLIFFRNPKRPDDILVKFLHNEQETSIPVSTDIYPFYHWKDVRAYYTALLDRIAAKGR